VSEVVLETVERPDLRELIAARLRYAIISREFPPGRRLRELPLAESFGVSRVPVREALIRLTHEGLVRGEPRRGAFVVGMSKADIAELYDVRKLIECRGGQLAASRATVDDVRELRRRVQDLDDATTYRTPFEAASADIAFHREVLVASHHRRLLAVWEPMAGTIQTLMSLTNERSDPACILSSHRPLVDAITDGDAEAAARLTLKSLDDGLANAELIWSD
jgi:DNA-binding GntR family transcriptional regulator